MTDARRSTTDSGGDAAVDSGGDAAVDSGGDAAVDSGGDAAVGSCGGTEPVDDGTESGSGTDHVSSSGDLVVVCGLPGVGKTTVAERIAGHVDARVLRTDVIRKELFATPEYTDDETATVYAELLDRARDHLSHDRSVVLDATFANRSFREQARELGDRIAGRFELVKVECDEAVVKRRIERRDGISDADFDVYLHFTELFDRIDAEHLVVDNSGDEAETVSWVDDRFA